MEQGTVILKNKRIRSVKNLGWLLKHGYEVKCFEIVPVSQEYLLKAYSKDFKLTVTWKTYHIMFSSYLVLRNFLSRPMFRDLPVTTLPLPETGGETVKWKGGSLEVA